MRIEKGDYQSPFLFAVLGELDPARLAVPLDRGHLDASLDESFTVAA